MVVVSKKKGENVDSLLRRFNKITRDENLMFEVSKKKHYLKPSLLRKEKQKDRLKRKAQERRRVMM